MTESGRVVSTCFKGVGDTGGVGKTFSDVSVASASLIEDCRVFFGRLKSDFMVGAIAMFLRGLLSVG